MPRRQAGARLYLHPTEEVWLIRDGATFKRTGHGAGEREQAEAALASYIASRAPQRRSGPAQPSEITVGEVLARYVDDRADTVKGVETLGNNVAALAKWWGNQTCNAVKGTMCRAYARDRGGSSWTSRRELGVLQAALNHAHAEGILVYPLKVTLPPAGQSRHRWLTRDEVAALLRAASPHARRFILVSVYTGRRMSAVLELTWTRVDLDAGQIRFRADGEAETKKRRGSVRIPRQLHAHLRRWHRMAQRGETHVVSYRGKPVRSIKTALRRAVDRAGLDHDINRHAMKHTAITWAVMTGLSVEAAAEFFDTSPATIRAHYWHHSPHHQAEGLAAMEKRG